MSASYETTISGHCCECSHSFTGNIPLPTTSENITYVTKEVFEKPCNCGELTSQATRIITYIYPNGFTTSTNLAGLPVDMLGNQVYALDTNDAIQFEESDEEYNDHDDESFALQPRSMYSDPYIPPEDKDAADEAEWQSRMDRYNSSGTAVDYRSRHAKKTSWGKIACYFVMFLSFLAIVAALIYTHPNWIK